MLPWKRRPGRAGAGGRLRSACQIKFMQQSMDNEAGARKPVLLALDTGRHPGQGHSAVSSSQDMIRECSDAGCQGRKFDVCVPLCTRRDVCICKHARFIESSTLGTARAQVNGENVCRIRIAVLYCGTMSWWKRAETSVSKFYPDRLQQIHVYEGTQCMSSRASK